jgi:hypothetical protein
LHSLEDSTLQPLSRQRNPSLKKKEIFFDTFCDPFALCTELRSNDRGCDVQPNMKTSVLTSRQLGRSGPVPGRYAEGQALKQTTQRLIL